MSKFVTLVEAAAKLGITPEQVNELRQRGELYGYRDGASWKFRPEDIDKVASRTAGAPADESDEMILLGDSQEISESAMDLPIDPDDIDASSEDVVLLSEFELGASGPSASNTVIGKPGQGFSSLDSDIKLVATGGDEGSDASKTKLSAPGSPLRPGESAVKLEASPFDEESTSKTMIGTPGEPLGPEDSAIKLQTGGVDLDNPSSTMIGKPGQPMNSGESAVKLGAFEDDEFDLDAIHGRKTPPAGTVPPPVVGGSAVRLSEPLPPDPVVDSGITLGEESYSDDDFVLGGPGSDITLSPGDSGISLVDPADSGLSLDAPIELRAAGSSENLASAGSGELDAETDFDSDEVMELKTSDEFLLTPMAAEGEDSSDDSGSQVIALDSESAFEASDASMFGSVEGSMSSMLEEDVGSAGGALGEGALGAASAPAAFATAGMPAPAAAGETPYPIWVVLLLGTCVLFLALCGMMMYDLVRNMWSWNGAYRVNSSIMDMILGLFGNR